MGLLQVIKNKFTPQQSRVKQVAKFLDGSIPIFSQFGEDVYASDVVQTAINCIATECSKLQPKHIRIDPNGMQKNVKSSLNRLFKFAPNEHMTTKDFIEKIVWLLHMNYNAFIYPTYDIINGPDGSRREYTSFYPLNPKQVDYLQDESGKLFIKFMFANGQDFTIDYSDIIHLRKKFSVNEIMGGGAHGQPDNEAILKVLQINDTVLQGLDKAIKTSLSVRGILKINTMLEDKKQEEERKRFEEAIKNNETGILPMDLKGDYFDIKSDPKVIDKDTLEFLDNKVLRYYGVSVPIISGDFTDEQYQAFYEKTLEPIIISLGQAFSKTIFTKGQLDHGNEIVFYPQRLLFTNTKNRIAVADILGNRGALTNNDLLQLFGYPPYDGGDVRNMSLNYIDVNLAGEYQMKRAGTKSEKGGESNDK
ncbi:phage portal protein [Chengkuizengella marina]|uniref:Phage portal protein n=1 Tax=Chengkuizengella marina TaxID=2507566 RepID=A0A6N9Q8M1_9BACL|nr:phage portal protein [Chengkuizengella marina]NBI31031.1 phage portal protein [Chengkuizengella marina]